MRRADRLFRIVQLLRSGRMQTGAQLAEKLEISLRTLYRDIADLQANGVLIEGEAGVGYTLRQEMDLPPMQFTAQETTALVLGLRMAAAWGGASMMTTAKEALQKIEGVLPARMRAEMDMVQMYAPPKAHLQPVRECIDALHGACIQGRVSTFRYEKLDGTVSMRRVLPIAMAYWGSVWTLVAWDEKRNDFRVFRMDRIQELAILEDGFSLRKGQRLKDFLRRYEPEKDAKRLNLAPLKQGN